MFKRSNIIIIVLLTLLTSCNEVIEVPVRDSDATFVVVEGLLTNMTEDNQDIKISRSLPFLSKEEVPAVSGAKVTVSDGSNSTVFTELESEKGTYRAPAGFACRQGETYRLSIKAMIDGLERTYTASSEMPGPACELDSIKCIYTPVVADVADSCWTVLIWGRDNPGDGYYLMEPSVNGYTYPFENHLIIDDYYFSGKDINGFPTTVLLQTEDNRKEYGLCAKYLETGDVIRLDIHCLTKDYYHFAYSVINNISGQSIPLFSPQPCNVPTNIASDTKEKNDALGYFSCSYVVRSNCTITDPFLEKHDVLK